MKAYIDSYLPRILAGLIQIKSFLKFHERRRAIAWLVLFGVVFAIYFLLTWETFSYFFLNIEKHFGYLDTQDNWIALDNFVRGKVFFKDYFYEYGWLLLFLESIPYLLFHQSFLGVLAARHLFLPLLGVLFAFIIGKNVLKKNQYLLLFLIFNLFYGATTDFSPVRHLMAELSLSFFIATLYKKSNKHSFLSGILAGLAVITALEYGVALNVAIAIAGTLGLFLKYVNRQQLIRFLVGETIILLPFFTYLYINGAFFNYFHFTFSYIDNFYYSSPCARGSFPRLEDIAILSPTSRRLFFNILPVEFLQSLNLYIIPVFYLLFFGYFVFRFIFKKKFNREILVQLSLVLYGSAVYVRTLDTPCVGYFRYGLVPFFLLLVILIKNLVIKIQKRKKYTSRKYFLGIFIMCTWFLLGDNTYTLINLFDQTKPPVKFSLQAKEYFPAAGRVFDKEQAQDYNEVTAYILDHAGQDNLYVYPWGPYNNLTGLPATNILSTGAAFVTGESYIQKVLNDIDKKSPRYIVINIYNNLGTAVFGRVRSDVNRFYANRNEDGPVFAHEGNLLEKYILENYRTVYHNDLAIIMEKRQQAIVIPEVVKRVATIDTFDESRIITNQMMALENNKQYAVNGGDALWELELPDDIKADDVEVTYKVDGDFLTKHLSRYVVRLTALSSSKDVLGYTEVLARKEDQADRIKLSTAGDVRAVRIEFTKNGGFAWWLHPHSLEIRRILFYGFEEQLLNE